jgi:hypothetical protein
MKTWAKQLAIFGVSHFLLFFAVLILAIAVTPDIGELATDAQGWIGMIAWIMIEVLEFPIPTGWPFGMLAAMAINSLSWGAALASVGFVWRRRHLESDNKGLHNIALNGKL